MHKKEFMDGIKDSMLGLAERHMMTTIQCNTDLILHKISSFCPPQCRARRSFVTEEAACITRVLLGRFSIPSKYIGNDKHNCMSSNTCLLSKL